MYFPYWFVFWSFLFPSNFNRACNNSGLLKVRCIFRYADKFARHSLPFVVFGRRLPSFVMDTKTKKLSGKCRICILELHTTVFILFVRLLLLVSYAFVYISILKMMMYLKLLFKSFMQKKRIFIHP